MSTSPAPQIDGQTPGTLPYPRQFNIAYKASKPPQFWSFYADTEDELDSTGKMRTDRWANLDQLTPQGRWDLFKKLLAQGFGPLDEEIEGVGLSPYDTNWMRQNVYGQTWEPAGQGDVQVVNVNQPGAVVTPGEFTGPVPAGQIKVSILISDFPEFPIPVENAPVPPPVAPLASPVGPLRIPSAINAATQVGGLFATLVNKQGLDGYNEGNTWAGTAQGLTGTWEKVPGMMGMGAYWEKIA